MRKSSLSAIVSGACMCSVLLTAEAAFAWEQEFWFVSDIIAPDGSFGCSTTQTAATNTATFIKNKKVSNAVLLTTEANNCKDYSDAYESNGGFFDFYDWLGSAGFDKDHWIAAPGNHDYCVPRNKECESDGKAEAFHSVWGLQPNTPLWRYQSQPPWIVVALDSELTESTAPAMSQQVSEVQFWLYMAYISGIPCQVVISHRPAYCNALKHVGERLHVDLTNTLINFGVELVLSGHEHVYERLAPKGSNQTVNQIVAGIGGVNMDSNSRFGSSHTLGALEEPGEGEGPFDNQFNDQAGNGVVRLLLNSDGKYTVELYRMDTGNVTDRLSGTCTG